eukprot:297115-Amphidinium_carterae.1
MGSRVGLGKARHVAVRYLWLTTIDKTIKLVIVKGTQHPPDVGTKCLSEQGNLHAKSMLGLMEPEALAPYGYEVPDSSGVRDKLDKSVNLVATIRALSMSDRKINGIAGSLMFVLAAGYAPVRAAASQEMEVVTFMDYRQHNDGDVVWRLMLSTLRVSITTLVIAVCTRLRMCQQQVKPQTCSKGTQTTQSIDREISTTRVREVEDIFVYPNGRRYHRARECQVQSPIHDSTQGARRVDETEVDITITTRFSSMRRRE